MPPFPLQLTVFHRLNQKVVYVLNENFFCFFSGCAGIDLRPFDVDEKYHDQKYYDPVIPQEFECKRGFAVRILFFRKKFSSDA